MIPKDNEVFINKIKIRKNKEKYEKMIRNINKTKDIIDNAINLLTKK